MSPTVAMNKSLQKPLGGKASVMTMPPHIISAGNLRLDCQRRYAVIDEKNIALAPIELNLLRCLLEARGRTLSRTLLSNSMSLPGRAQPPKLQSVDVHIKRLRRKLGATGHSIITVRNVGYRFEICREWINQEQES